jgi:hypothetical protein
MRLISLFSAVFCASSFLAQEIWMTPNSGQWDDRIHYSVDLTLGKLFLQKDGMCFMLTDFMAHGDGDNHNHSDNHDHEEFQRIHVIHQKFIGSNTEAKTENNKPSTDLKNYIIGQDSSKWKSNIHSYNEVHYKNFYDNIDLIYKGENSLLSYNFMLKPGADVSQVKWNFEGANKVFIKNGVLVISNRFGLIEQSAPEAYEIDESGHKSKINIRFRKNGEEISFDLPDGHDLSKTLYIDPSLTFSSFSGSLSDNWGFTATPDPYGNLFGGGIVMGTEYPVTTGAYDLSYQGGQGAIPTDIGITKFNAQGTSLLYSTYIGGSGNETPP